LIIFLNVSVGFGTLRIWDFSKYIP
jgi:hypothetical protein